MDAAQCCWIRSLFLLWQQSTLMPMATGVTMPETSGADAAASERPRCISEQKLEACTAHSCFCVHLSCGKPFSVGLCYARHHLRVCAFNPHFLSACFLALHFNISFWTFCAISCRSRCSIASRNCHRTAVILGLLHVLCLFLQLSFSQTVMLSPLSGHLVSFHFLLLQ